MYTYTKDRCFRDGSGVDVTTHRITGSESEHLHEFIELVYILSGSGIHGIDGVEYPVRRGSLLLINYCQVHYFRTDSEMEICNILLDPEWISEKLIDSENAFELLTISSFSHFQKDVDQTAALVRFSGPERLRVEGLLWDMKSEMTGKEPGFVTVLKAQITVLLTMVFRKMSRGSGMEETAGLTPEFLSYIRHNCSEKLTLEDLAKKCFYNPSYFSRIFKEHYGVTVTEFINQSRLEKAMELLTETNLSVEEIVSRSGFPRKAGFYRLLKEKTGMTPQDYRKSKKS